MCAGSSALILVSINKSFSLVGLPRHASACSSPADSARERRENGRVDHGLDARFRSRLGGHYGGALYRLSTSMNSSAPFTAVWLQLRRSLIGLTTWPKSSRPSRRLSKASTRNLEEWTRDSRIWRPPSTGSQSVPGQQQMLPEAAAGLF